MESNGKRISTLDLFDASFVVLTGADGAAWCDAASIVATSLGIRLTAVCLGSDALDLEHDSHARLGNDSDGAMLVRPDSFVAWRTRSRVPSAQRELSEVFSHILNRPIAG